MPETSALERSAPTSSVLDAVAAHAHRQPEVEAVVCAGRSFGYGELDRRSSQLARALGQRGVGPGALIGIALDRSVDLLVAMLAVWKSGAAYVPVDPSYPRERNGLILGDAGVAIVLTDTAVSAGLPLAGAPAVELDRDWPEIALHSDEPLRDEATDDALAYVIYTSGSTGRPKGVMVEHGGLRNLLAAMAVEPGLTGGETMLGVTTPAFDLSVPDLFLPLVTGARLVLATRAEASDPKALAALLERFDVSLMQATPSTWRMLIDDGWDGEHRLRAICGGEDLPAQLAVRLVKRVGALWNFYGPTEATVWSTCARVHEDGVVSLGEPLPNTTCLLLDEDGEPVAEGEAGELWIGGAGIARGYLNLPELTGERFVGGRYRTGDLAQRRADGRLHFQGRADLQVKLRGYRIELGEIEAVLARHADVTQAVATLRPDARGEPAIVAYVVAGAPAADGLRHFAREHLPAYMLPAAIVPLQALPLTPNGKVDRAALPEPDPRAFGRGGGEVVAPRTAIEARLLELWRDVLRTSDIGITDDFFDLGVDSLTAARLFTRIEHELNLALPLSALFEAPTVERLAVLLDRDGGTLRRWSSLVPLRAGGTRPVIACIHGGAGTVLFYNDLVRRLGDDQPVLAFQAAGLYGREPPHTSIQQMARAYVAELTAAAPEGPYILAGYCYGGMVAYEMAQQLSARGVEVLLLVMLNAPSPTYNETYKPIFDEGGALTDHLGRLRDRGPERDSSLRGSVRRHWSPAGGGPVARTRSLTSAARRRARVTWQAYVARLRFAAVMRLRRPLPDDMRESRHFAEIAARAQRNYHPAPYEGAMVVFRSHGLYYEEDLGWQAFVRGPVECHEVPGRHDTPRDAMSEPAVGFVAERLAETSLRAAGWSKS